MPETPLAKVERLRRETEDAETRAAETRRKFEDAIREARAAGEPLRLVALVAGVSRSRVSQLTTEPASKAGSKTRRRKD